jgi:prepilin signal peptidase PulO-like enzyme (type II secretory pathway)
MDFFLFLFGASIGSFLNVLALRYDPDKPLFARESIGGRSRCPMCAAELRWFELIPLLSYLLQGARCRSCGKYISAQYPIVEIISGFIFVLVPLRLHSLPGASLSYYAPFLWILVFLTLLLVALIDIRLDIIPDEANVFLFFLGFLLLLASLRTFSFTGGSFVGGYAFLFGLDTNIWLSRLYGILAAALFFSFLILVTRGKAMGVGDLKLGIVLGAVFGWPDILFVLALSFIVGSVFGLGVVIARRKTLKSFLPLGPFLALGSALVFFAGYNLLHFYFQLVSI